MFMDAFRTKCTPKDECVYTLFLFVIIAIGLAASAVEVISGSVPGR